MTSDDLFPVALPNGEPGTIFIKMSVDTGIEPKRTTAYVGPFETLADAQDTIDRIIVLNRTAAASIVDDVDLDDVDLDPRYFPIDRAFINNTDIVAALRKVRRQADAALRTGDYEQWRDKPDEAAKYMDDQAAEVARRARALMDAGTIPDPDA